MSTANPEISVYDKILMNRDKLGTLIKTIEKLQRDKSVDLKTNGEPDLVSMIADTEENHVIVQFNCGGNLCKLISPAGGRKSKTHIVWHPDSRPGHAKEHIHEPVDPVTPKITDVTTERGKRQLTDIEKAQGDIDYRRLVREFIK